MPVLVVGADTPVGEALMSALTKREGEIRAFVTDPDVGAMLKTRSVKVAIGDVSDPSHIGAAGLNCYSIVFLAHAAVDDRERSFATTPEDVLTGWVESITESGAQRAIWVEVAETERHRQLLAGVTAELAVVPPGDNSAEELARIIAELDDIAVVPVGYRLD